MRTTSDTTRQSHLGPLLAGLLHLDLVQYSPRLSRQKLRSLRSQLQVGRGSAVLVDDQLLPQESLQYELPEDPVGFQSGEMSGLPVQRVTVPPSGYDLLTLTACQQKYRNNKTITTVVRLTSPNIHHVIQGEVPLLELATVSQSPDGLQI